MFKSVANDILPFLRMEKLNLPPIDPVKSTFLTWPKYSYVRILTAVSDSFVTVPPPAKLRTCHAARFGETSFAPSATVIRL